MEGSSACKIIFGSLTSPVYKQRGICIVTATNAVACKNFGVMKDVVEAYPYADVAGMRYTKPGASYACQRDRSVTGTAILNTSTLDLYVDNPVVATLITQYGIGKSIENNPYARNSVQYSQDLHHVNGLREDTEERRLHHFHSALTNLKDKLNDQKFDHVQHVLFPLGIGRRGRIDAKWLAYYLPSIFAFNQELEGRTVYIVAGEKLFSSLEEKHKGDMVISNLLGPLRKLEIVNNFVKADEESRDTCGADRGQVECRYLPMYSQA